MRSMLITFLLALAYSAPLSAGVIEEGIFRSGFEFSDQCTMFNGLNDSIIVPAVTITGDFTLNSRPFPVSEYDDGVFSLRDPLTGDVFELGNSHDLNYSVNVVAGHYDVMYSMQTPGLTVPRNVGAVIMENVALVNSGTLDINLTSHILSGEFLHNDVLFPASEYDDANIFLDGEMSGRVEVGNTHIQTFSGVVVLAGDYEIRYQVETPDTVPWNEWGLVGLLDVAADMNAMKLNVQSVAVSGTFSHNNSPMPVSEFDDGLFFLEQESGDRVFLENSHAGGYAKHIIPGKYDAYWELQTPGDTVPFNERARVASNLTVVAGLLDVDMISYPLTGSFTLNGGPFPDTFENTGEMILRDPLAKTDSILAKTMDGEYQQRVVNGAYEIVYRHLQGALVPQNKDAILHENVVVNLAANIDINITARLISTGVYHNGALFPASAQQMGNILLRDRDSDDQALLGKTSLQTLSALVKTGTYDVYYSHLVGDQVPQNQMARFQQNYLVALSGPAKNEGGAIQFVVNSAVVTGNMYLNDVLMPASEYDDGLLSLQWEGDFVPLANTHDQSYQVRLLTTSQPGFYWVHYQVQTAGDTLPLNGDARVMCALVEPQIF